MPDARAELLARIVDFAARDGLADRSLRQIASGAGTSHRMLLFHFGSREGLLTAVVGEMEARQRAAMTQLAESVTDPADLMTGVWRSVSNPEVRPFVRLFFEVFALAARGGTPGTAELTTSWLDEAEKVQQRLGITVDRAMLRLGVAVNRGLLMDLLAGDDPGEVDAAHDLFVQLAEHASASGTREAGQYQTPGR
jgi:AcrR family transcriptional regulator